jgi:DNA polymerase/3'-5' exonuclease PolX
MVTPEEKARQLFEGIHGVGHKTAEQFVMKGARTLDDLSDEKCRKFGIELNKFQKIGLEFYEDIQSRIPRSEAEEIFKKVEMVAKEVDPKLEVYLMGSYRRGKADCGDVDCEVF